MFKRVHQQQGEGATLQAVALMQQGTVVDLDSAVALTATRLSADLRLPMADSVVYATAQHHGATVWTQDSDFERLPGIRFTKRR